MLRSEIVPCVVLLVPALLFLLLTQTSAAEPEKNACDEDTHYTCGYGPGAACCWHDMNCCRAQSAWYCSDVCK